MERIAEREIAVSRSGNGAGSGVTKIGWIAERRLLRRSHSVRSHVLLLLLSGPVQSDSSLNHMFFCMTLDILWVRSGCFEGKFISKCKI